MYDCKAACEADVKAIKGELFHREDVGTDALVASRVAHMLRLQAEHAAASGTPVVRVGVLGSTRGTSLQGVLRAISGGEITHLMHDNCRQVRVRTRCIYIHSSEQQPMYESSRAPTGMRGSAFSI